MGSRVTSDEHLLSPLKYQPNSRHNCNTEKESDRQIYPTPALCFRFRCIIHLCANLEEPSQSPSQHQKEERSKKETGGLERRKSQRERRRRRKDRERERREENTRTKERGRQTQEKRGAGMAQTLSCNVVKHPNRISNDPGRLLPICF